MMKKTICIISFVFIFFALPMLAFGATYYIDFSGGNDANNGTTKETPWKYCPGMTSEFTGSYSHSAGDKFIFKGGETWTPSGASPFLVINWSGSSGSVDEYTVDNTYYSGASFTAPTITAGSPEGAFRIVEAINKSYVKINGINFINIGSHTDSRIMSFEGTAAFEISYNTFTPEGRACIVLSGGYQLSSINIHHNTMSRFAAGIWGSQDTYGFNSLLIHHNIFGGPNGLLFAGGQHIDDIHLWRNTSYTTTFSGLHIYNNKFSGILSIGNSDTTGYTARIFLERGITEDVVFDTPLIYNNLFEADFTGDLKTGRNLSAVISAGGVNVKVLNNTFVGYTGEVGSIYTSSNVQNLVFENNIITGHDGLIIEDGDGAGGSFTIASCDYNIINTTTSSPFHLSGSSYNFTGWNNLGYDLHSSTNTALLLSASYPADFTLQTGSPAIGSGADLSSIFTTDYTGATRTTWDIGAYAYAEDDLPTGSLTITISPSGAISAGARWMVDGGSEQTSGATVTGLSVGMHAVTYKAATSWKSPATATATIADGETTTATGTYLGGHTMTFGSGSSVLKPNAGGVVTVTPR